VHDVGTTGDGRMFIAMEYVRGTTLADRRLPLRRAVAAMREAALAHCTGRAREAIEQARRPQDFFGRMGWVLLALENAFFHLKGSDFEAALVSTVEAGGDTDTNAAICGALLGAALGKQAIPPRWILPVLACRATVDAGAPRPRPASYWPDDILELAEALLQNSGSGP
jgi:ADP-ribosylglycohydrolase